MSLYFVAFLSFFLLACCNLFASLRIFGAFAPVAYAGILSYAITQHRLLDLSLVFKKGFSVVLLTFGMSVAFVTMIYLLADAALAWAKVPKGVGLAGASLLVCLLYLPFKRRFRHLSQRLLGLKKLDFRQELLDFSMFLGQATCAEEPACLQGLCEKLKADLGLQKAVLLLRDPKDQQFEPRASSPAGDGVTVFAESRLCGLLNAKAGWVELEEWMARRAEAPSGWDRLAEDLVRELEFLGIEAVFPVKVMDSLHGLLLLGAKDNGLAFNHQELAFFATLSLQLGTALEQALVRRHLEKKAQLRARALAWLDLLAQFKVPLQALSDGVAAYPAYADDQVAREWLFKDMRRNVKKMAEVSRLM